MEARLQQLVSIEHGFRPFEEEAKIIFAAVSAAEAKHQALDLLGSPFYQLRSVGVFLLGFLAVKDKSVLDLLKKQASSDESWQVQEIIAKAFDRFCQDNGYGHSLTEIEDWLGDRHPNVCRAVTEGLRIWTNRPYFREHPE